jgi:hypothetical protein
MLRTNIRASLDDSCTAHMLDVGFVYRGIMCCAGECWFFATVTTSHLALSNHPFLSITDLIPALGLYLDAWNA